jgi:hypothetical protein
MAISTICLISADEIKSFYPYSFIESYNFLPV